MAKTLFENGMPLTPELLNRLNNPVYVADPKEDGEIPYPPAAAILDDSIVAEKLHFDSSEAALESFVGVSGLGLRKTPIDAAAALLNAAQVVPVAVQYQTPPRDLNYVDNRFRVFCVRKNPETDSTDFLFTFLTSRGPINTNTPIIIVADESCFSISAKGPYGIAYELRPGGWLMLVPTGKAAYKVLSYSRGGLIGSDQIESDSITYGHLSPNLFPRSYQVVTDDFSPQEGVAYLVGTYEGAPAVIHVAATIPSGTSIYIMGMNCTGEKNIFFPNPEGEEVALRVQSGPYCHGVLLIRFGSGYIFVGGG